MVESALSRPRRRVHADGCTQMRAPVAAGRQPGLRL